MSDMKLSQVFENIGRLYAELVSVKNELTAARQQQAETARVAGEALRALEDLKRKDVADAILKGERWSSTPVSAPTAEK